MDTAGESEREMKGLFLCCGQGGPPGVLKHWQVCVCVCGVLDGSHLVHGLAMQVVGLAGIFLFTSARHTTCSLVQMCHMRHLGH